LYQEIGIEPRAKTGNRGLSSLKFEVNVNFRLDTPLRRPFFFRFGRSNRNISPDGDRRRFRAHIITVAATGAIFTTGGDRFVSEQIDGVANPQYPFRAVFYTKPTPFAQPGVDRDKVSRFLPWYFYNIHVFLMCH